MRVRLVEQLSKINVQFPGQRARYAEGITQRRDDATREEGDNSKGR